MMHMKIIGDLSYSWSASAQLYLGKRYHKQTAAREWVSGLFSMDSYTYSTIKETINRYKDIIKKLS